MMRRLHFLAGVALLGILAGSGWGQNPDLGTSVAVPFKVPVSARQVGMGDAFAGLGDVNAMLYNPAGLILNHRTAFTGSHNTWFLDMYQTYFGYVTPTQYGVFGIGSMYFNQGRFEIIENGTPTGELANVYDFATLLSYGARLHKYLALGITGKFIHFNFGGYTSSAFAVDAGVLVPPFDIFGGAGKLSLGAVLQNFGTDIVFIQESWPQPYTVRAGLGLQFPNLSIFDLILAADVLLPSDADLKVNAGAELWVNKILALRGGYLYGYSDNLLGQNGGGTPTFGVGLRINRFQVDYAYVSNGGTFDPAHRLSLAVNLGVEKEPGPVRIQEEQMKELKEAIAASEERIKADITDVRQNVEEIKRILRTSLKTVVTADELLHLLNIHFPFGSAVIPDEEYPKLYEAVRLIKKYYPDKVITVEGHTDEAGDPEVNMELSRRRAEAVKAFLVENGIPENQIVVVAKGETEVLSHRTGPGTSGIENRRVVFVVAPDHMMEME